MRINIVNAHKKVNKFIVLTSSSFGRLNLISSKLIDPTSKSNGSGR